MQEAQRLVSSNHIRFFLKVRSCKAKGQSFKTTGKLEEPKWLRGTEDTPRLLSVVSLNCVSLFLDIRIGRVAQIALRLG